MFDLENFDKKPADMTNDELVTYIISEVTQVTYNDDEDRNYTIQDAIEALQDEEYTNFEFSNIDKKCIKEAIYVLEKYNRSLDLETFRFQYFI